MPADSQRSAGWGCYDDVLNALERAPTGRQFIAGDKFTMADLYVGAHLGWGLQFGTIEPRTSSRPMPSAWPPARRRSARAKSTTP